MLIIIGTIVAGLALLVWGGEILLRGAVGCAQLLRMTPAVVGLTVVAAATSVPELAVSLLAAVEGTPDIAVGNVVGSNIANLALILGLSALVSPLVIRGQTIKLEYPFLLVITYLLVVVAHNGEIDSFEGSLLILLYLMFTGYMVALVRGRATSDEEKEFAAHVEGIDQASPSPGRIFALIFGGAALLWLGADLTVGGAVQLAKIFGISDRVIGLTVVAVGTSLPEIVASVLSSLKGRADVAIGNVIGSNIFNILIILGAVAVGNPIPVNASIVAWDNWWMLGVTVCLFPLMVTGLRVSRLEGGTLLLAYVVYISLVLFQGGN